MAGLFGGTKFNRDESTMTKSFKDLFIKYNPLQGNDLVECKCGGNCKCKPRDATTARALEIIDQEINAWGYGTQAEKALSRVRKEILKSE